MKKIVLILVGFTIFLYLYNNKSENKKIEEYKTLLSSSLLNASKYHLRRAIELNNKAIEIIEPVKSSQDFYFFSKILNIAYSKVNSSSINDILEYHNLILQIDDLFKDDYKELFFLEKIISLYIKNINIESDDEISKSLFHFFEIIRTRILLINLKQNSSLDKTKKYLSDKPITMFILDASTSMYYPTNENNLRIDSAREAIKMSLKSLDINKTNFGLITFNKAILLEEDKYGNSITCNENVSLIVEPNNNDKNIFLKKLMKIYPSGNTPLAQSIKETGELLKNSKQFVKLIIISDGEESCGGDPIEEAKKLKNKYGMNVDFVIIGFNVSSNASYYLKRLANTLDGEYTVANNMQGIINVINRVNNQKDSDDDGVPNIHDNCQNTPQNTKVDAYGCTVKEPPIIEIYDTKVQIGNDYANVNLKIIDRGLGIGREIFKIDNTMMDVRCEKDIPIANNTIRRSCRVGIPTGKHNVSVYVYDEKNITRSNIDNEDINSTYKAIPSLHILLMGVKDFEEHALNTLLFPIHDVNLTNNTFYKRSGLLFGKKNIKITVLRNATRNKTIELFEKMKKSEIIKPNDYFILYGSSHGKILKNSFVEGESKVNKKARYFFISKDYIENDTNNAGKVIAISQNELSNLMISIPTIFRMEILDTCYSGKAISTIQEELEKIKLGEKSGVLTVAATKNGEKKAYEDKNNGLFTTVFNEGLLKNADINNNQVIDSLEIVHYLEKEVILASKKLNKKNIHSQIQIPNIYWTGKIFDITAIPPKPKKHKIIPYSLNKKELNEYKQAMKNHNLQRMQEILKVNIKKIGQSTNISNYNQTKQLFSEQYIRDKLLNINKGSLEMYFDTGSSSLNQNDLANIALVAKVLKSKELQKYKFIIEGFTDNTGNFKNISERKIFNKKLSRERAINVKNQFIYTHGIANNRFKIIPRGEDGAEYTNDSKLGRSKNRRIKIIRTIY